MVTLMNHHCQLYIIPSISFIHHIPLVSLFQAISLKTTGNLMELVDPKLNSKYDIQEMMVVINLAILCIAISPINRPTMSSVVSMLEGRIVPQEYVVEQGVQAAEIDPHTMMKQHKDTNESQITKMSIRCNDSSKSVVDLYPVDGFSDI
ncbi:putative non-specific serine/threonine protein kinase [Helianthus annuus]|nr:putative non-specific serine/threonine protein kinase [Helianthus annuus]